MALSKSQKAWEQEKKAKVTVNKILANMHDICVSVYLCPPHRKTRKHCLCFSPCIFFPFHTYKKLTLKYSAFRLMICT